MVGFLVDLMQISQHPISLGTRAPLSHEVQDSGTDFHRNKQGHKPVVGTFRQENKYEDICKRDRDE
jgi:hypothetical protein